MGPLLKVDLCHFCANCCYLDGLYTGFWGVKTPEEKIPLSKSDLVEEESLPFLENAGTLAKGKMKVYPNPTQGQLLVQIGGADEILPSQLSVYDM